MYSEAIRPRTVAIYREDLLPPSETFIPNEALALRRYSAVFAGEQRRDGLQLPRNRVVLATPGGRWRRAVRRRLPRHDPAARLARACRSRGVDLVHAHFGTDAVRALRLAEALEVPLVVTFHGYDATLHDEALLARGGTAAEFVHRRPELFERASAIVAVSRFIADELRRKGAPEGKLRVHHNGVPLGPARRREPPLEPLILFVGRHVEKKGIGDLLEAMPRVRRAVPAARLVVVGDGPLRAGLEERARRIDAAAQFPGWVTPEDVETLLDRARVLCVPSRRAADGDAEGLPTVIPEAGARGLPVVGTRHSGIPEAIGDERGGLLADEGDVEGIAAHLIAVLQRDELWRRLSRSGRENVERHFHPARQAAELEAIYDEVLLGRATSR